MTSLLQTLTDAGIPHHVIAEDLHKFVFFIARRYAKIGICCGTSISRLTATVLPTCGLPSHIGKSMQANDIVTA